MNRPLVILSIAQVLVAIAAFLLFFTWVPWIASDPIAEVAPAVAISMPAGCPAVFGSHGQYSCFWPGQIHDHPLKFALISAGLLAAWAFLIATALLGGRVKRSRQVEGRPE